jgi:hypothetical protein
MKNITNTKLFRRVTSVGVLSIALLGSVAFAQEKIVSVKGTDLTSVQRQLDEGWTVKTAYGVIADSHGYGTHSQKDVMHVFVLVSPSPERLAENEAKRRAEFEKRRAEHMAKKNQDTEAK